MIGSPTAAVVIGVPTKRFGRSGLWVALETSRDNDAVWVRLGDDVRSGCEAWVDMNFDLYPIRVDAASWRTLVDWSPT